MDIEILNDRGIVLLGCGKMGSAMLRGWLNAGVPADKIFVIDPAPSDWVLAQGVRINDALPASPAIVLIAVKPQVMVTALPQCATWGNGDTLFITVAAGVSLQSYSSILGADTPIIRAMPNTPAAIGQGITAMIGNGAATSDQCRIASDLLSVIGKVITLEDEALMDAVTAVSGSGPAYVFYMIEVMAAAGQSLGLPDDIALQLAKATVAGAGALACNDDTLPAVLRENVTSPNGTTFAALQVLMHDDNGLAPLMRDTIKAASMRSKELSNV